MPEPKPKRPTLKRLFGFTKPNRWQYLTSMLGIALANTAVSIFIAYVLKGVTDALMAKDLPRLTSVVTLSVLFFGAYVLVIPFPLCLWRSSVYRITMGIRQVLFDHLERLPLDYHTRRHSGDVMSVLTNDLAAMEQAYRDDLLNLLRITLAVAAAAILMFSMQWELALVIVVCGLVPLAVSTPFAQPLRRIADTIQARLGTLSERLSDLLAGYQVIRAFNLGQWIVARFDRANADVLEGSLRRVRLQASLSGASEFAGLCYFLSFAFGGYLVLKGQTTFGVFVALTQLSNHVLEFTLSLGGTITRLQSSLAAADRVLDVLDAPPEPERLAQGTGLGAVTPAAANVMLEFRDVTFGYEDDQGVLKGLSFEVRQGQVAALVGPSGSGKSTIYKLLLGCYPVRAGAVLVSGRPISDYPLRALRDLFAYVPQDAYLYAGTILENIRYGRPGATDDEALAAARAAYAHDFITELPDGYAMPVGEGGARLSGGQRQRIAIVRALLKDAPILLLDEATSALDSESERQVQEALQVLMHGRTTVAIAHRLSTIEQADVIYVLDSGAVAERGRHSELVAEGGLYSDLHALQFKQ